MPEVELNVSLIEHTPDPEKLVATAAKMCYTRLTVGELRDRVTKSDQRDFIKKIMEMGHLTPIEHAVFTFGVEGVSRALLAQITRHRIATFCVKSQRYVDERSGGGKGTFNYVVPPSIRSLGKKYVKKFGEHMKAIQGFYDYWYDVLGSDPAKAEYRNEDSRFVLPNAAETKFVFTMNTRELLHFFGLRLCMRAQWEIRALAKRMHAEVMKVAPTLFSYAGPPCKFGECREGTLKCIKDATR